MFYKQAIYIICTFISYYAISGINFNGFFKTNKIKEAKVFVFIIAMAIAYLLTNYIIDFTNLGNIIS